MVSPSSRSISPVACSIRRDSVHSPAKAQSEAGPVTLAHGIHDVDGWRMIVSSGEIVDTEPLHINESSLIVRVDKPVKQYFRELVELGYTHHIIAVSGDVTAQVEMFARQAGIHVDRL